MGRELSNRWQHELADGRLQCDLCPRDCRLHDGQRGACFVRMRQGNAIILTAYGRSSGFCIDPIEKKPLNHFYPGSRVLSFGTAGCNLACKFCQNWDISKSREMATLADHASPEAIAAACVQHGAESVAFTYNDPVVFAEYAIDTADACHSLGIHTVAVTAGYINAVARRDFFSRMDAANVDLKAFSDDFYVRLCGGHLQPVLDTLCYLKHDTAVWLEITTLLIPGENDSAEEITAMCRWIHTSLGDEVPLHFTAFHPAWKMPDHQRTTLCTLQMARNIALQQGLRHVYLGNVQSDDGAITYCAQCHAALIRREGYTILDYRLHADATCPDCGALLVGCFSTFRPEHEARRQPLHLGR